MDAFESHACPNGAVGPFSPRARGKLNLMPAREEMPDTIRRSSQKAQRTWAKAHDAAVAQYGEGERAHRTAFSALKHSFQKKGDRWVAKAEKGPSDPPDPT
ncbi:MAG TPA: ChaB family protein, partial [Gaiellaceae bacterium]|nr:ChaB family protein [Gaiellaceae bacterium]